MLFKDLKKRMWDNTEYEESDYEENDLIKERKRAEFCKKKEFARLSGRNCLRCESIAKSSGCLKTHIVNESVSIRWKFITKIKNDQIDKSSLKRWKGISAMKIITMKMLNYIKELSIEIHHFDEIWGIWWNLLMWWNFTKNQYYFDENLLLKWKLINWLHRWKSKTVLKI